MVFERRIVTRADQFAAVFGGRARMRILLGVRVRKASGSPACLEALGHEAVVADPNYAADVRDADAAGSRRIGVTSRRWRKPTGTGIYRPAYRVRAAQRAMRQRLLVRSQLVRMRTPDDQPAAVASAGEPAAVSRRAPAETFARAVRRSRAAGAGAARPSRPLAGAARGRSRRLPCARPRQWARQAAAARSGRAPVDDGAGRRPRHRAELSRHARSRSNDFPMPGCVTVYLGLVPREDSSGGPAAAGARSRKPGPASRGRCWSKRAWHIWRSGRGGAIALHAWVHRLGEHGGADASPSSPSPDGWHGCLYAMWRDGRDFDRHASARADGGGVAAHGPRRPAGSDGQQHGVASATCVPGRT